MRLTERQQAEYRRQIADLESAAASYMEAYLDAFREGNPKASVAEIREATILAIDDALNAFGKEASAEAGRLFDEICESEGIEADFEPMDVIDPEMIDQGVRYRAREIVSGNDGKFKRDIADLTRFYVKRTAFESIVGNCDRNGIQFARVPSGTETCAFCFMLSSRGFVYRSELTARGRSLHGMHQHCDCIVVPGIPGKTVIEGYDPDAMYDRWKQCAETVGVSAEDASSFKYRQRIMDEVAKRDWRWLNSSDPKCVSKAEYLKPRDALTDNERSGVDHLARRGFKLTVNREDPKAPANIDLTINDELWEMKNVGDGKHSIDDNITEARRKWRRLGLDSPMKVVVTTEGRTKDFGSALAEVERRLRSGEEALVIDEGGGIMRIRK